MSEQKVLYQENILNKLKFWILRDKLSGLYYINTGILLGDMNHALIFRSESSVRNGVRKRIKLIQKIANKNWNYLNHIFYSGRFSYRYQSYGRISERIKMEYYGIEVIEFVINQNKLSKSPE